MNAVPASRKVILILLAILLMSLAACLLLPLAAWYQSAKEGEVKGTVTMAGVPLKSGTVYFIDQSGNPWHSGIDARGAYQFAKVPVGPVKIKVVSHQRVPPGIANQKGPDDANQKGPGDAKDQKPEPPAITIPKKYNDAEKSGLIYEVKLGPQRHDIELTK